ncbi:MAG: DEAD/DEAH box helicase [Holophagaceae bacterium]
MSTITFRELGCEEPFLSILNRRGFTQPLPVQASTFKMALAGRDVLVQSQTGSGKTLAYALPLLHKGHLASKPQTIVLTPTRELAQQVHTEVKFLQPQIPIALLVGGVSYVPQLKALSTGASFIVGTPGRVLDHVERGTLKLADIKHIVLDECDEMLNVGFLGDVEKILNKIKGKPQILLFSATLPLPIRKLANRFLKDPFQFSQTTESSTGSHIDIEHTPIQVEDRQQVHAIVNLVAHDQPHAALIFCKTKHKCEQVSDELNALGLSAAFLHGDLKQNSRTRVLDKFKHRKLKYLVATDVAARGLDINGLPMVIHVGVPNQMENYIHRSGRTGRAGAKGVSVALVNRKESQLLRVWSKRLGFQLHWRNVPNPVEVMKSKSIGLLDRIRDKASPSLVETARILLESDTPENLIAGLLGMTEMNGVSKLAELPKPSKIDHKTERKRPFRSHHKKFDRNKSFGSSTSRFKRKHRP